MTTNQDSKGELKENIIVFLVCTFALFIASVLGAKFALALTDVNVYLVGSDQCIGEYYTTTQNLHD